MNTIKGISNDTPIVMTFGDLKQIIADNVNDARREELEYVIGFVPRSQSIRMRLEDVLGQKTLKKKTYVRKRGSNKIKVTVLNEVPETIKQYMVREQ